MLLVLVYVQPNDLVYRMVTTVSLANMRRPLLVFYPEASMVNLSIPVSARSDDTVRLMFTVILYFTEISLRP